MGKFLNTAFLQAISATGLGTANFDGRGHVLKATSNDWLSVTYMMKHLADATTGIAAGGDAGKAAAQAAYDQVAAIFLGCGNKNPVELPTFPNVTWGTTYATKGPTYYTVAPCRRCRSATVSRTRRARPPPPPRASWPSSSRGPALRASPASPTPCSRCTPRAPC